MTEIDYLEKAMRREARDRFKALLRDYIDYCNQVFDYNKNPPKLVTAPPGRLYTVKGDIRKVRRREEPTLAGFLEWLEQQND